MIVKLEAGGITLKYSSGEEMKVTMKDDLGFIRWDDFDDIRAALIISHQDERTPAKDKPSVSKMVYMICLVVDPEFGGRL